MRPRTPVRFILHDYNEEATGSRGFHVLSSKGNDLTAAKATAETKRDYSKIAQRFARKG
jgi:hypothetical protein